MKLFCIDIFHKFFKQIYWMHYENYKNDGKQEYQ